MKTIIQITLEVEHDEASVPADVASRVAHVVLSALNGVAHEEELLSDVPMHGSEVRGTKVLAAEEPAT